MVKNSRNFVIGANGLVGGMLFSTLIEKNAQVAGTCFSRKEKYLLQLDLNDLNSLTKHLSEHKPQIIYLASNFPGGVNRVEENQSAAKHFYIESLKKICEYSANSKSALVFYSTDYVFDDHENPVREDESKKPLNYYGKLKDESEKIIINSLEKFLILRTTNVYGYDPKTKTPNFLMQAYLKSMSDEAISIDPDSLATPTYVNDLVAATFSLLEKEAYGIYHVVGDEYLSRLEWAKKIKSVLNLSVSINEVRNCNSSVKRPLKLRLDNSKVKSVAKIAFSNLDNALMNIKHQISK